MIYYCSPYSRDKDIGTYYNRVMKLVKDTDFVCFYDGDAMFTTPFYGTLIEDVIKKHPECEVFTCRTNRVGCEWQCVEGTRDNTDIEFHRNVGEYLSSKKTTECEDISTLRRDKLPSGIMILTTKRAWRKAGKFRKGMLGVDNDFFYGVIEAKMKLYVMLGVYMFHWYRGGNKANKQHLKVERDYDQDTDKYIRSNTY